MIQGNFIIMVEGSQIYKISFLSLSVRENTSQTLSRNLILNDLSSTLFILQQEHMILNESI